MKEAKESLPSVSSQAPGADRSKDQARSQDNSERQAAKHGEGVRPTGHDSVC